MSDSPAVILFDELGHPVGVNFDGYQYRVLVDSRITDADGYNVVGITNIAPGVVALKVDVVKSVSGGGVGVGGTSSNFVAPFPSAGTAVGFYDGYYMQSAEVYNLNTSVTPNEFVLGMNLRTFGAGGSVEVGTVSHPLQANVDGYVQTNPVVIVSNFPATQTITGTVTANQGTNPWLVQDTTGDGYLQSILANQTNGTQQTIIDGYVQTNPNVNVISFPNDVHVIVDGYVQTSPNVNVINIPTVNQGTSPWVSNISQFGGNNVVTGTGASGVGIPRVTVSNDSNVLVTQSTSPWITHDTTGDGYLQSILANQTNGTQQVIVDGYVQTNPNVNVISFPNDVHVIVDGYVQTNPNVNVNNFPATQTIAGTVTANQGTNPWITHDTTGDGYLQSILANQTNANQTNGTQQVIVDGYVQTNPNVNIVNTPNVITTPSGDIFPATINITTKDLVTTSVFGAYGQPIYTGTPTVGSVASFATSSQESFIVQITGNWVGTLQTESSIDGINWYLCKVNQLTQDLTYSAFTANFIGGANISGFTNFRVRATSGWSGVATVKVTESLNVNTVYINNQEVQMTFGDDANTDAFQRLRISSPQTLFDCKQLVDNQPLFFDDQQTSGSGTTSTFVANQSMTKMSVSNLTAGTRVRQSFERFNYQPGKSIACFFTGVLGSKNTGIKKRIGYFDGYNGLFFELNATDLRVVIRTNTSGSPVDGYTTQANWNFDKLDGYGPSGLVLDITKTQIFFIDFQWLGVGRVRFGFNMNGMFVHVHEIDNANATLAMPYMSIPNLPARYEISNDGTGPIDSLYHICVSIESEGGLEPTGLLLSADGYAGLTTNANTLIYPLLVIRLKAAYQMATVDPNNFSVMCSTDAGFRMVLLLNPTITGTSISYTDITNSALQQATPTNGTTVSGGTLIYSTFGWGATGAGNSQAPVLRVDLKSNLRIGSSIAGASDILVLGVQSLAGGAMTFYGSISWIEKV